ncbi:MAG TPA: hypothetical protein ENK14_06385 [Caldithrix sp.]|nr:hypothetical protein [Caldithrix sp.]
MRGESRSLIWGILLIIVGLLFLGNNLDWFYLDWETMWPLLMIIGGVLFWIGWLANRKETGLLMPGTILLAYGLLFEYCVLFGWYWMDEYWPVFLLGPGLGFLFMYFLGNREKGLLIPAGVLIVLSLLFWSGRDLSRFLWPLLLVGIGVYLLLGVRRAKERNKVEKDSLNDSDKETS